MTEHPSPEDLANKAERDAAYAREEERPLLSSVMLRREVDDFLASIQHRLPRGLRVILMLDYDLSGDNPAGAEAIWRIDPVRNNITPESQ